MGGILLGALAGLRLDLSWFRKQSVAQTSTNEGTLCILQTPNNVPGCATFILSGRIQRMMYLD